MGDTGLKSMGDGVFAGYKEWAHNAWHIF